MNWRILVLEDDPDLREMLASVLQDEGYQVWMASAGEEAVKLAAEQPFDLLVTDVRMPGVDGLEALRQVRDHLPDLDSLVVSGYTSEAETLRALQLHVGGFLKKPFQLQELLSQVRQLLEQRLRQREHQEMLQSLRRSLHWLIERSAPPEALEESRVASYLAQQAGLPVASLQLWAQLRWLGPLPAWTRQDRYGLGPLLELSELPPQSREHQILEAAHWYCQGAEEPAPVADEFLLEQLRRPQEAWQVQQDDAQLTSPSLLVLAQSLFQKGQWELSSAAYRRLLDHPSASPQTEIRAHLGLAQSLYAARQSGWFEALKAAEAQSRQLSPQQGAQVRWSIARLLGHTKHPSAANYLLTLEQEFSHLGLEPFWAKARLLGAPDERSPQAARLLLEPRHLSGLQPEGEWLIGAICNQADQIGTSALWCRLAGEFPQAIRRWLEAGPAPSTLEVLWRSWEEYPEWVPLQLLEGIPGGRAQQLRQKLTGQAGPLYLQCRSFGYFDVVVNGQRCEEKLFKTQKFRLVLAYLLLHRQGVQEEVLMEDFWPNSRGSGKASVYAATTAIRRALRQPNQEGEIVVREGEFLRLHESLQLSHDYELFEQGASRLGQDLQADLAWSQLYTGPYLQGTFMDWALQRRQWCEERLTRGLQSLSERCLLENPQLALELSAQGLELDPLSQDLHALKMRAHLELGQPEKGIRQFQKCQSLLAKELAIEPLTHLFELYQRCRLALP